MPLSHEHLGSKILAEIEIYILTRAELLCPLCYEIPCNKSAKIHPDVLICLGAPVLKRTVLGNC